MIKVLTKKNTIRIIGMNIMNDIFLYHNLGKTKSRGLHHFEPLYPKVKAKKEVQEIKKNKKKSSKKPNRKSTRKPTRKSNRKPNRKSTRKPTRKSTRKSTRKPNRKSTRKSRINI